MSSDLVAVLVALAVSIGAGNIASKIYDWIYEKRQKQYAAGHRSVKQSYRHAARQRCVKGDSGSWPDPRVDDDVYEPPSRQSALNFSIRLVLRHLITDECPTQVSCPTDV